LGRRRAEIAQELLPSLDDGTDKDRALMWVAELEQRAGEALAGSVANQDWEAFKARLTLRWHPR